MPLPGKRLKRRGRLPQRSAILTHTITRRKCLGPQALSHSRMDASRTRSNTGCYTSTYSPDFAQVQQQAIEEQQQAIEVQQQAIEERAAVSQLERALCAQEARLASSWHGIQQRAPGVAAWGWQVAHTLHAASRAKLLICNALHANCQ